MKLIKRLSISLLCTLFLSGCWDQNLLKDVKLVMGTGFDLTPEGKLLETVTIPEFSTGANAATTPTKSQIVSAIGNSTRDARNKINNLVTEQFDPSKQMIILFGKEYAKKDIYPALDSFYTDAKSSLVANAAIVDGMASNLLRVKTKEKKAMSTYLSELIQSAQSSTVIPKLQGLMLSHIYNPGQDLTLPLLHAKANQIEVKGLALFNGSKYTGKYLPREDSTLYIIMNGGKIGKEASINVKVHQNEKTKMENYITINVIKSNQKLEVIPANAQDISIKLKVNIKAEITEYPKDHLNTAKKVNLLSKEISTVLTKEAHEILKKTQNANSDIFGIGKHVLSFHNSTWKQINWKKTYPKIKMQPIVHVDIVKHGVFN
ncbi:Ger(x)C family spore germination protein [Bacillus cereus]|nr:Ger(x)C family spore germination protein [Bacillus cereus]